MSTRAIYKSLQQLSPGVANDPTNDPTTYCINKTIDSSFMHSSSSWGQSCKPCQAWMSQRCSENWDNICEYTSYNTEPSYPNNMELGNMPYGIVNKNLIAGEILIRNTFSRKYLTGMYGSSLNSEPFDPNVMLSPQITFWDSGGIPVYEIKDVSSIDNDIVMNKVLDRPYIADDMLINIYNTMKRKGTLPTLKGTRLEYFFKNNPQVFS